MAQRFEGRNLDEALDHAAETLGVDRHRLTHSVILEKRGFLGGMKRVVIEADVTEGAAPPATSPPAATPPPVAEAAAPVAPPVARERGGRGPRGGGRGGRGGNRRDDRPRRERR